MEASLEAFKRRFGGRIVLPAEAGYEKATKLDISLESARPAMVVWPRNPEEVAEALRYAQEAGLPISVRSGGHAASGQALVDKGMTIHVGDMKGLSINRERGTVRAQAGCLFSDIDKFTHAELGSKAAVLGFADTVGSGYALYGGFGSMSRKHGLCIDNLVSVELVTADGRILNVSETENPDLWWAVRGGGATLGIVTAFEHRLFDVSTFYGGSIILPENRFHEYNRFIHQLRHDNDLVSINYLMRTPQGPVVFIFLAHWGSQSRAEKEALFAPIQKMAPMQYTVGQYDYFQFQGIFAPIWHSLPSPRRAYWTSGSLKGLENEAGFNSFLDAYFEVWKSVPPSVVMAVMNIELYGGAIRNVPRQATAYWPRETEMLFGLMPTWLDPAIDAEVVAFTRKAKAHLSSHPLAMPEGYLNFSMHEEAEVYYGGNLERLSAIKAQIDPKNIFHRCVDVRSKQGKKAVSGA
ncbi:FAD-binding oxidoreductase [Hyalangium rubrum]|uniref:FAD-binding oxidoreductase n=1 Tax=Hyalangium rubrum TaxID=3103134 RepID=A0ABU5GX24_9BACT|nr:FAD-binding oxidoreductase [Hyalangium sp. s54d21]MDY7225427.1 FAD-binding oxidoreductase [Hyalangium sp. s54d21]